MAGGFSPGTAGYGADRERRFRHQTTRNMNIADIMIGLAPLIQQAGNFRRSRQGEADEQATMQAMSQMDQGGMPEAVQGPQRAPVGIGGVSTSGMTAEGMPAPAPERAQPNYVQQAADYRPAGVMERFGQTFFGQPVRGRLRPESAMKLREMQDRRAADAATGVHQREMEGIGWANARANQTRAERTGMGGGGNDPRSGFFQAQRKVDELDATISALASAGPEKADALSRLNKWPTWDEAVRQRAGWVKIRDREKSRYEGGPSQVPDDAAPADPTQGSQDIDLTDEQINAMSPEEARAYLERIGAAGGR